MIKHVDDLIKELGQVFVVVGQNTEDSQTHCHIQANAYYSTNYKA